MVAMKRNPSDLVMSSIFNFAAFPARRLTCLRTASLTARPVSSTRHRLNASRIYSEMVAPLSSWSNPASFMKRVVGYSGLSIEFVIEKGKVPHASLFGPDTLIRTARSGSTYPRNLAIVRALNHGLWLLST